MSALAPGDTIAWPDADDGTAVVVERTGLVTVTITWMAEGMVKRAAMVERP